jgi:hypothetical protein
MLTNSYIWDYEVVEEQGNILFDLIGKDMGHDRLDQREDF